MGKGGDNQTSVEIPEFQRKPLEQLFRQAQGSFLGTPGETTVERVPTNATPYQRKEGRAPAFKYVTKTTEGQEAKIPGGPEFFPGDTVADLNPDELAAMGAARGAASSISGNQLPAVRDASQFGLNLVRDIPNHPVVQAATEAAITPVQQRLQRQVLPGIDSGAIEAGQVGSSRHGVAQGNAINDFSRAALDATAGIQNQALGRGMQLFSNTLAQQPNIAALERAPGQILDAVGQRNRAIEQANINEEIARHNFNDPFNKEVNRIAQIRDLLIGNFGGTTTAPSNTTSPLAGAAGGALTGFGATGNPMGAVIGGGLGLLGTL